MCNLIIIIFIKFLMNLLIICIFKCNKLNYNYFVNVNKYIINYVFEKCIYLFYWIDMYKFVMKIYLWFSYSIYIIYMFIVELNVF